MKSSWLLPVEAAFVFFSFSSFYSCSVIYLNYSRLLPQKAASILSCYSFPIVLPTTWLPVFVKRSASPTFFASLICFIFCNYSGSIFSSFERADSSSFFSTNLFFTLHSVSIPSFPSILYLSYHYLPMSIRNFWTTLSLKSLAHTHAYFYEASLFHPLC